MRDSKEGKTTKYGRHRPSAPVGRLLVLRRLPLAMQVVLAAVVATVMILGIQSTAQASSTQLCNGWTACSNSPYTTHGYQNNYAKRYWGMDPGDQCTNYAAYVESSVYGVPTPGYSLGNGGDWATNAKAHGVTVDGTPTVGAVAEWNSGDYGMTSYGHVAIVEQVGPNDSYIVISQQDIQTSTNGYDWMRINAGGSESQWEEWPDNFIHFNKGSSYEAAFEANTTSLWTAGSAGTTNWQQGMMAGTSPAITALPGGGYEMAFQANTGSLITVGTAGNTNWGLGMYAGTSPSITAVGSGYEVAFEANTTSLWTAGSAGTTNWGLGMYAGTSPSITTML